MGVSSGQAYKGKLNASGMGFTNAWLQKSHFTQDDKLHAQLYMWWKKLDFFRSRAFVGGSRVIY